MTQVFFDDWENEGITQLVEDFEIKEDISGYEILFAAYTYEDYSGDAVVLAQKDGKLFEVHGGHCSCYGLEGQWECEEVSGDALLKRLNEGHHYSGSIEYRHKSRLKEIASMFVHYQYDTTQAGDTEEDI